jgi:hypothetical protein
MLFFEYLLCYFRVTGEKQHRLRKTHTPVRLTVSGPYVKRQCATISVSTVTDQEMDGLQVIGTQNCLGFRSSGNSLRSKKNCYMFEEAPT